MNKDELSEIKEYHLKKVIRLFEVYIYSEINYKDNSISDSRLLELEKLIPELKCEIERIKEINTMLHNCDN